MASKTLRELARGLRKKQTSAEDRLWQVLHNRNTGGLKFRRQHPVAGSTYVADFCCYQARLLIELDGDIHKNQEKEDSERQEELERLGYTVLRFSNDRVLNDLENVLVEILYVALSEE